MALNKTMGSALCLLAGFVIAIYGFSPVWFAPNAGVGSQPPLMTETIELIVAVTHWEWILVATGCFALAILSRLNWRGKKNERTGDR